MHVLVATQQGQGKRTNDFSFAEAGELVMLPSECDGETVDGRCGCRRAFSGFNSHKSTTTAQVVDLAYTPESYRQAVADSLKGAGWVDDADDPMVVELADELVRLAAAFPVGMVIEKRGTKVQERRL